MEQGGQQRLALLPKQRPTPVKSLSAPALSAVMCVMLMAPFAAFAQHLLAPQGLKNNSGCELSRGSTLGCPAKQGGSCSIHKRVTGKWL